MKTIKEVLIEKPLVDSYIKEMCEDIIGSCPPESYLQYKGKILFRIINDIDIPEDVEPVTEFFCKKCGFRNLFIHKFKLGNSAFNYVVNKLGIKISCEKCGEGHLLFYFNDNNTRKDRYKNYLKNNELVFVEDWNLLFFSNIRNDEY